MDKTAYYKYANSRWTPPPNLGPWDETFPTHSEHHDYFYDAPLDELPGANKFWRNPDPKGGWTTGASIQHSRGEAYYASVSFNKAIGNVKFGFSEKQLATLREQIRFAEKSGLQARYWDLPSWPINYRDYVWDVLTREGVGMLSVDGLESAARRGWSKGYIRSVTWMICVSVWIFGTSVLGLLIVYRMLRKRTTILMGIQERQGIYWSSIGICIKDFSSFSLTKGQTEAKFRTGLLAAPRLRYVDCIQPNHIIGRQLTFTDPSNWWKVQSVTLPRSCLHTLSSFRAIWSNFFGTRT